MAARRGASIQGIDIFLRPRLQIPVLKYDGVHIPHPDQSFDAVIFLDVLHHTTDPMSLLREACRVSRKYIIMRPSAPSAERHCPLASSCTEGQLHAAHCPPRPIKRNSVPAVKPSRLWSKMSEYRGRSGRYPFPGDWIFERSLHFVARLEVGHGDRQRAN